MTGVVGLIVTFFVVASILSVIASTMKAIAKAAIAVVIPIAGGTMVGAVDPSLIKSFESIKIDANTLQHILKMIGG